MFKCDVMIKGPVVRTKRKEEENMDDFVQQDVGTNSFLGVIFFEMFADRAIGRLKIDTSL